MLREFFILLSVVALVTCNHSCWFCSNEPDAAVCWDNTITCSDDEQCFVETVVTDMAQVVYNAGCRSNAVCQIMASIASVPTGKRSLIRCAKCCTGPHCQDNLCGSTKGGNSGLTCLSCNSVTYADACQKYEVCQDTEVCYAGINIVESVIRNSYRCKSKHECQALAANEVMGHTGRDVSYGLSICDSCCVSDHCNRADCHTLKKNMTVSMFST